MLTSGQTIQYPGAMDLLVTRPNRIRATVYSTRKRREYFCDGKTLTIFAPRMGFYAVVQTPPTIRELADEANAKLGLVLPLADVFDFDNDPALTARIKPGFFVSTERLCSGAALLLGGDASSVGE